MTSKYELAISSNYVPDWGIKEAFRELFQNALDNQIMNPDNKMGWEYDKETKTLKVSNKTSKLTVESLLLGSGTKANNANTIGKHGEGYKIAFMVLLRNNKQIKVFNYGAKEMWEVRFVKSKKYNGELLTTVFIDKCHKWEKVPNNDLTIEVNNITEEEYNSIVESNLNLRQNTIETFDVPNRGRIILTESEKSKIYVKGLYITNIDGFNYGYDFEPSVLGLDRDRRMVDGFNASWEASILWKYAAKEDKMKDKVVELVDMDSIDTQYITKMGIGDTDIYNVVADAFKAANGEKAIPVTNNDDYEYIKSSTEYKPVIVSERKESIIKSATNYSEEEIEVKRKSVKEELNDFITKIEHKLTDDELKELQSIAEKIAN